MIDLHCGGADDRVLVARMNQGSIKVALTKREQEILTHLSHGLLYKEIADALGISIETVRTHIRNIYEKLQVRTRRRC